MKKSVALLCAVFMFVGAMTAQQVYTCHSSSIPAPTAGDLDPKNRHTACPYQGIALAGTPSKPNYSLVWEPVCGTASPQQHSGDSVTISYQSEVCDVRVYNYDRVLQCLSKEYYVHRVSMFMAEPLNLPPSITATPGTIIDWTEGQIPDQSSEGMLYEWELDELSQQCGSVQGSQFTPGIKLAVNDFHTPNSFYVKLRRTFCGCSRDTYINIVVSNDTSTNGSYNDNAAARQETLPAISDSLVTISTSNLRYSYRTCNNTPIELTASLDIPGRTIVSSLWDFGDGSRFNTPGNSFFHTFMAFGTYAVNVIVTDNEGYIWKNSAPFIISSFSNTIKDGSLSISGPIVCPFFGTRDLVFDRDYTGNRYQWWRHKAPTHVPNIYPYPSHQSDDYFTYVINDNYCQAEATTFVKFKNAPTAHIYSESFTCCVDNEITLYGETGPSDDQMSYNWSVTGPGTPIPPCIEPTFRFIPTTAGTYTVTLTVTNSQGCSSTTSETVTATPKPTKK